MVQIKSNIYNYSADEKIIGAEIIVYNESGDKVKSIVVVDETEIDELRAELDTLDDNYVDQDELTAKLANASETTTINATKLNGLSGDSFVLESSLASRRMTPTAHASSGTTYGRASNTLYGHVKTIDNLSKDTYTDGEALSAHQGYVLDEKISNIKKSLGLVVTSPQDTENKGVVVITQGSALKMQLSDNGTLLTSGTIYYMINGVNYSRTSGSTHTLNLEAGDYYVNFIFEGNSTYNPLYRTILLRVQSSS